jgi:hypothetical protein
VCQHHKDLAYREFIANVFHADIGAMRMTDTAERTADLAYLTTLKIIRNLADTQIGAEEAGITVTRALCMEQLNAAVQALTRRTVDSVPAAS